jgi:ribosomal protein S11
MPLIINKKKTRKIFINKKRKFYFRNRFKFFKFLKRKTILRLFNKRRFSIDFFYYNFKNFDKIVQKRSPKKRYIRLINRFSYFNRFKLFGRKRILTRFIFYKKSHSYKTFIHVYTKPKITFSKRHFFRRLFRKKRFFVFKFKRRRYSKKFKTYLKQRLRFSKRKYKYKFVKMVQQFYVKRKAFRKLFIKRIFRWRKIRRIKKARIYRFVSLFSRWRPISRFYYFKKRLKFRRLIKRRKSPFTHFGLISKKIWSGLQAERRVFRSFRSTYFVKLIQSYNNFFLQLCNSVSQRVYFTFTAGRVPILRRNRRKTTQTLTEAANIFSKRLKDFNLKFIQLWIIGPMNYFIRKFVKVLKINKLRISSVTHLVKYSHNGLRSRALRRV